MAGVFDAQEIATVSDWIRSLAAAPHAGAAISHAEPALASPADAAADAGQRLDATVPGAALLQAFTPDAEKLYARLPMRELYHRLLHAETWLDALPYARRFAAWWLS